MLKGLLTGLALIGTPAFAFTGAELGPRCGGQFGLCGFANLQTEALVIPQIYGRVFPFSNGLAAVRFEGRWGYIDTLGDWVIEPRFDLAGRFRFGRAEVLIGEHVGVIDRQGALTVPAEYARAIPITPDVTLVEIGAWRAVHYAGSEKLDIGLFLLLRGQRGLLNAQNIWITEPNWQAEFRLFDPEGRGLVWASIEPDSRKKIFGLMDARTGEWVSEPKYQSVLSLSENLTTAREFILPNESNGSDVLDQNGNIVFHTRYDNIHYWKNGFALVVGEDGQSYGLMDRQGNLLGGRMFEEVREPTETRPPQVFENGHWYEVSDGRLVDVPTAHIVPPPSAPQPISPFPNLPRMTCSSGTVIFKDDESGLYGMKTPDGIVLIEPSFPALGCFRNGIAWAAFPDEGQWCPIGPDGLRRDTPACAQVYYPEKWSHHYPEKLDEDPFTSSLFWVQRYLAFWAGELATPPMHVGDGVQGYGKIPAFEYEMAGWD